MTIKFIEKAIEDPNTGADVKYHEITAISVDYRNRYASITVESYISQKAKQAGKQPVGHPTTLSFNGNIPTMAENPIDFFYAALTQAAPADYVEPNEDEKYQGWVDPYLFSGGKVKEVADDTHH